MVMILAALVNAGTFAALTFLALVATDVARLERWWVPMVLVLFGIGSFAGVTIAGRLSDRRPRPVLIIGGVGLTVGWVGLAACSSSPTAFLCLVFVQGVLSFGVGSTLITRVLYAASAAPTMGGSYATAALNVGAVVGPLVGAMALATPLGPTGPIWVAATASGLALLIAIPAMGLIAPRGIRSDGLAEARR
jgi:DHA1 family chloramphenicol resistance protein-like MFS transporter